MDKNGPEIKIDNGELATSTIPEDFTEPQVLYEKLIKMIRQYHPSDDISMIEKAYRIAYKAHDGQLRKSGEPYIIHPVCVCIWQSWSWTKKRSWPVCSMMWWRIL